MKPRLREYAHFELAVYVAMLVVDLAAIGIATVFSVTIRRTISRSATTWSTPRGSMPVNR
jgi:hypothetical protein